MIAEITVIASSLKAVQIAASETVETLGALGWSVEGISAARRGDEHTITVSMWRKE